MMLYMPLASVILLGPIYSCVWSMTTFYAAAGPIVTAAYNTRIELQNPTANRAKSLGRVQTIRAREPWMIAMYMTQSLTKEK